MKPFFNLLIIVIFPFVLSVSAASLSNDPVVFITEEYCNARYGFCLQYPSDILTNANITDNGDGIQLSNPNNQVEVWAFGTFNIFNDDVSAIVEESIMGLSLPAADVEASNINIEEGYGEFTFKTSTHWNYQKIMLFNDAFIKLAIKVPYNQKTLLEEVKKDIRLDILL